MVYYHVNKNRYSSEKKRTSEYKGHKTKTINHQMVDRCNIKKYSKYL